MLDCIDCVWKFDIVGLWFDDWLCYWDKFVWIKEYGWDLVLNVFVVDDMDWNLFYYFLKKFLYSYYV